MRWTMSGAVRAWCLAGALLSLVGHVRDAIASPAVAAVPADADELRQALTEREDENRVAEPWSTQVLGHPLTLNGQYEIALDALRRLGPEDASDDGDRLLLEQELETELFYTLGPPFSFFAQLRLKMERDLDRGVPDRLSKVFVERGEMWLYMEDVAGTGLDFEIGRLDFEDDRLWWWDADLDAVRVTYEAETWEVVLAAARELAPSRLDRSYVEPEEQRVLRLMAELAWDWRPNHALELFALHHRDRSPTERPGRLVRAEREDESDARLTWLGARLVGAWLSSTRGILGYWADLGLVHGEEDFVEFDELSRRRSRVDAVTPRDVRGWAFDLGATWIAPWALGPRLSLGYARGSGDRRPEEGADRSFRQTGIHGNEVGFGGVQRFSHYGELLDPELSNLAILTVVAGISLFESSSLDLSYNHYRLVEPATSLRDSRLDPQLTGAHRSLGHGANLVLALEEWQRVELELIGSAFRAGRAFGEQRGTWGFGGFVAVRVAF